MASLKHLHLGDIDSFWHDSGFCNILDLFHGTSGCDVERIGLQFWCQYKEIQSIRALRIRVWRVYGRAGLRWGESLVTIWLAKRGEQKGLEKKNPVHPEARALSALITSLFIGIWTKWLTVMIENGFLRDIKWHVPVPFGIWAIPIADIVLPSIELFICRTDTW